MVLGLAMLPTAVHAEIWSRARTDGTVEFTNQPAAGGKWKLSPQSRRDGSAAPVETKPGTTRTATVWAREREGGVVEFTNLQPVGAKWKVWLRTGPGKAASVRGASDVVPARDRSPERFARYDEHIQHQFGFYGIPLALVRAVIKTESDFDPRVVSSAGAKGLMQLMPDTAREMGVSDPFDPRQNIMGGSRYLQLLVRRFCRTPSPSAPNKTICSGQEVIKVIAGYHAGPGAVEKYGGIPPYETTRAYVGSVLRRYQQFRKHSNEAAALAER